MGHFKQYPVSIPAVFAGNIIVPCCQSWSQMILRRRGKSVNEIIKVYTCCFLLQHQSGFFKKNLSLFSHWNVAVSKRNVDSSFYCSPHSTASHELSAFSFPFYQKATVLFSFMSHVAQTPKCGAQFLCTNQPAIRTPPGDGYKSGT